MTRLEFPVLDVTVSWVRDHVEQVLVWSLQDYENYHDARESPFGLPVPYFRDVQSPDPCTTGMYLVAMSSVVFGRVESLEVVSAHRSLADAVGRCYSLVGSNLFIPDLHRRKNRRGQLDVGVYVMHECEIWHVVPDDSLVDRDCSSFHADIVFLCGERVGIDFSDRSVFDWLRSVASTLGSVRVTELSWKVLKSGREVDHRFVVYSSPDFVPQEPKE